MQRMSLTLMTVLMLSALGGGNVKASLAQTADDCPRVEISGASGRSVCEYVGEVVWTWTAPVTGPVVFDTRGSSSDGSGSTWMSDTRLVIHAGDGLHDMTEVASNEGGASTVRLNSQQGQMYRIHVDLLYPVIVENYGPAGTIVLNWRPAVSCGNSDTSLVGSSGESGLREAVFDDPDPGEPAYVLAGPKASVWYWMTDDAVTQSLYVSTDGSASVRTFHDADGLPHKVIDECTGNWMLIQRYDAENVDFWFYDADGNYQSGLAVFEFEGNYYYAEIDGVPVHAGKRITGILRPTGASWTGNYTLEVDMSEIQDGQPVSNEIAALINGLSLDETGSRDMGTGWRSRFATILGPLGAWLSPEVAIAQPAVTVQDAMFWGGLVMVGAGAAGIAAPVYVTAGAFTFFASYLTPDVAEEQIRPRCPDSPRMAHDLCHWAANNLARPGERGPIGFVSDLASDVEEAISGAADAAEQVLGNIRQFFNPPKPPQAKDEPIRLISDDTPPETVSGTMTDGTATVDVTGTVTSDGDFDVADDDGEVQLQLSVGGGAPVEGSFEWDGVEGEVEVDSTSDLEDWEVDNDVTTTDDEQTGLDGLLAELEEAERLADQAASGAEEARRLAEQVAGGSDGTSTTTATTTDTTTMDEGSESDSEIDIPPPIIPTTPPQAIGSDLSNVEVIGQGTTKTLLVINRRSQGINFQAGTWLEPKDGSYQRMIITRTTSVGAGQTVELPVACMQRSKKTPASGLRFFSQPKGARATDPVQQCQINCLSRGESQSQIQSCVWGCERQASRSQSVLIWPVQDGCNDGHDMALRFFDKSNNRVWPGSNQAYVLNGAETYRLACIPGAQVCLGATLHSSSDNSYWGIGIDGDQGCSACCYSCPNEGEQRVGGYNLTCQ